MRSRDAYVDLPLEAHRLSGVQQQIQEDDVHLRPVDRHRRVVSPDPDADAGHLGIAANGGCRLADDGAHRARDRSGLSRAGERQQVLQHPVQSGDAILDVAENVPIAAVRPGRATRSRPG
ncbi:MAG: hypothetical protein OXH69_23665 [Acidobacteria bacterium]|nr:hypothetical protein [Acidobacteriota bacterium]